MKTTSLTELRKHISKFIDSVEEGEPVRIYRHGKPVAEIRPIRSAHRPSWKEPGLKLQVDGVSLSKAILREREDSAR